MTTLRDRLIDAAKGSAAQSIRFTPKAIRTAGADGIVGPVPIEAVIDETGLFTTPELLPGSYEVRIKWRVVMAETYPIAVPETGDNVALWPLIADFVQLPPDTPQELLAKYFVEHPIEVGVADGEVGLAKLTPAVREKVENALTQEQADTHYAPVSRAAKNPDEIAVGAITRSASGAATSFGVVWDDGATGVFTGTESTSTPGAIDSYTVTHVLGGVTTTYTQPALTPNASGAVTARPAMTVS